MHETGHSKLVYWDNPEGWGGQGDRSGVWVGAGGGWEGQDGEHMYTHG